MILRPSASEVQLPEFLPTKEKPGQGRPSPRPTGPQPVPALGGTEPWVAPAPNEGGPQLPPDYRDPFWLIMSRDQCTDWLERLYGLN